MQPDPNPNHRKGLRTTLAIVGVTAAGAAALMGAPTSLADPPPPPPAPTADAPPPPANPDAPPPPANPFAPSPAAADPNAPAPDPNAPPPPPAQEPGRVNNAAGGFSFVVPPGWTNSDASRLTYGQALLTRAVPQGQTPPNDSTILLGKLDLKLFAGAEPDDTKAAIRLASDMGEFFMPFPGTRINQETTQLNANGMPGAASYYEVKFTDTSKPNGQIWAAAIGTTTPRVGREPAHNDRWFVVWLGNANAPIDKNAAKALAESIRPWTPPPPPEAPPTDTNAPAGAPAAPGAPGAPPPAAPGAAPVGVPVPVAPENAPPAMLPPSQ
ncbi:MAG: hypothetical protein JO152_16530 [Mycobacteriaceae bacterium]|nr:hypothetical protein [Mycobacteriaceae bacterium]